jgi:type I restriction enzyme S subunit
MNIAAHLAHESYKDSNVEWLGTIPHGWKTRKLKFVTQIMKRIAGHEGPDVLSITQNGIKIKDISSGDGQIAEDYSNYQLVFRGDFAMNHMDLITGYVDISSFDGVVSPDYRVFRRTSDELDDRYLLLILQIGYKQRIFFRYGQGVSLLGRWRFPAENFKEFQIPIPPLPEQRAIAAFLDEKCARVDEAVRIKEEQIALLRERRQILIQQAVTCGLNPAAPLKDSGIDWIGRIPAHWALRPNKHIFRLRKNVVGKRSSEFELLSLTLRGIIKRDMENPEGKFPAEFDTYQEVRPGDFVFCHFDVEETPRTVGLSKFFGMITGAYTVYSVSGDVDPRFLLHFYVCADTDKKMRSLYKGLRNTIPKDAFGAFKTPLPPLDEQRAIVAHIDRASGKIEDAISIKEQELVALKEYKTSLINAAVTGKIMVA